MHWLRLFKWASFGETSTRLLICYAAMMSGMIALSIPIANHLIIRMVAEREQENLEEVIQEFRDFIDPFVTNEDSLKSTRTIEDKLNQFLFKSFPEDDFFLISIVRSEFKASSPIALPVQFGPGSP